MKNDDRMVAEGVRKLTREIRLFRWLVSVGFIVLAELLFFGLFWEPLTARYGVDPIVF
jgi:hypothetical protein